ncbi:MAG: DUF2249 domain-containing protein [Bradymonadaceae bacterium]
MADRVVDLDVRPILEAGGQPIGAILDAIDEVLPGGALRLRAPFKPAPLFRLLQDDGWAHWIEFGAGTDWSIWFYRVEESAPCSEPPPTRSENRVALLKKEYPELQSCLSVEGERWIIDVRNFPPPEPMELTLIVLEKLPIGTELIQWNRRIPKFLLPHLNERGIDYEILNAEEGVRLRMSRIVET